MNLWSEKLLPLGYDFIVNTIKLQEKRKNFLSEIKGENPKILEIGIGTGLNLTCYPERIDSITAIDPNPGMEAKLYKKIKIKSQKGEVNFPDVEFYRTGCEDLPFEDDSFDVVISTLVLCSIPELQKSLSEIKRVLKPTGSFHFFEHGLSDNAKTRKWQRRLNPVQKFCADGCSMTVDIKSELLSAGFKIKSLENYHVDFFPKILGYIYDGEAVN